MVLSSMEPFQQPSGRKQNAPPFIVESIAAHKQSIILLHGLGSNGEEFGKELLENGIGSDGKKLQDIFPGARFIFPTAKWRRSSAFGRIKLTQWFDMVSLKDPSFRNYTQLDGLEESSQDIRRIISEEKHKVGNRRVFLGGLSQGMAIAIITLLTLDYPLGGFVGMSGWMPYRGDIQEIVEASTGNDNDNDDDIFFHAPEDSRHEHKRAIDKVATFVRDLVSLEGADEDTTLVNCTPVFLGHGRRDDKIKAALGKDVHDTLDAMGFTSVTFQTYDEGHWYKVPEEIDDIVELMRVWIRELEEEDCLKTALHQPS